MTRRTPRIETVELSLRSRPFTIEYVRRDGTGETILFVHGLGGAKENFWQALQSGALAEHTLIAFDNPGTGNSTWYDDMPLDVDDLAELTARFVEALGLTEIVLVGASMGGLITLLYLRLAAAGSVKGYINIEGNLMPEDCIFSSKVIGHDYDDFLGREFARVIGEMKLKGNPGYHVIATNLELNTDAGSYYHYSFKTVEYSGTGELLRQYMSMEIPRLFVYGDRNRSLSYLPQLVGHGLDVREISGSDHFIFHDNPAELYAVMAEYIGALSTASAGD